jgi:acyl-CoA thioester hydrolase
LTGNPTSAAQGQDAETLGVEVWRGAVNTWECDEMGHMNVRFYVARAVEGLVGMAAALGLRNAYAASTNATLVIREQHIRFLREARARAPLHMRAAVIEMLETEARLLLVLYHSVSGEPAATFQVTVAHVTPTGDRRPFDWTPQAIDRAKALTVAVPTYAAARSLDLSPFESRASLARADALDLTLISGGAFGAQDCDVFGRMNSEQFIGRVSDGIPNLIAQTRNMIVDTAETRPANVGGAVLEYRLAHLDWPRAGDRFVIRSGLAGVDHRTQRMVHWMLDPATGKAWGTSEAVAITLDLDARKIVPISDAAQAAMRKRVVAGLGL